MKKIIPHILFFLLTITAYSQGVFFNLGKNFSTIQYKNKSAFADKLGIKGFGDAYEIGYTDVLKYKNFKDLKYSGSVTINDYNAIAASNVTVVTAPLSILPVLLCPAVTQTILFVISFPLN